MHPANDPAAEITRQRAAPLTDRELAVNVSAARSTYFPDALTTAANNLIIVDLVEATKLVHLTNSRTRVLEGTLGEKGSPPIVILVDLDTLENNKLSLRKLDIATNSNVWLVPIDPRSRLPIGESTCLKVRQEQTNQPSRRNLDAKTLLEQSRKLGIVLPQTPDPLQLSEIEADIKAALRERKKTVINVSSARQQFDFRLPEHNASKVLEISGTIHGTKPPSEATASISAPAQMRIPDPVAAIEIYVDKKQLSDRTLDFSKASISGDVVIFVVDDSNMTVEAYKCTWREEDKPFSYGSLKPIEAALQISPKTTLEGPLNLYSRRVQETMFGDKRRAANAATIGTLFHEIQEILPKVPEPEQEALLKLLRQIRTNE